MDVAQAFSESLQSGSPVSVTPVEAKLPPPPPVDSKPVPESAPPEAEEDYEPPSVKNLVSNWGPRNNGAAPALTAPALERRKSSYEKYSSFVLPPVKEERTPVSSPAGTLARGAVPIAEPVKEEVIPVKEEKPKTGDVLVTVEAVEVKPQVRDEHIRLGRLLLHPTTTDANARSYLVHADEPLPRVDVDALYRAPRPSYASDPDVNTISVDVLAITGNTASALTKDSSIFYDAEVLAVIHRAKVRSSGLVQTKVWGWHGRRAQVGEREAQKLQELARRYGASPVNASVLTTGEQR